jgi:3-hydroxyisobutyrate dehydrogenase-like beta-hydroxyacid dehydrogenase
VLPDAQAVGLSTRTLILSLPTSENRRALCWGEQRLADAFGPATVILDTTTGRPEDIEEDSRRLAGMGVKLADVCLVGSSQVIAEGRAVALVGDARETAAYADALNVFSKAQYFLGAPGQGSRVKLIANLVLGLNRLALAEGLGLADRAGFDLGMILDILKIGDTYSVVMDTKGAKMVSGNYEPPVARLAQHAKDVHLILDYARQLGASLPVTETHAHIIDDLVRNGCGELDNAAIFKAYCP